MPKLERVQIATLERFNVYLNRQDEHFFILDQVLVETNFRQFLAKITETTVASSDAVATSIYCRRHGFLLAAMFHLLSEYHLVWDGDLKDIALQFENENIVFSLSNEKFERVHDRHEAIRFILEKFGHPVIETISRFGKVSKLILWENVWGYVIWMYSMLFQQQSPTAREDLRFLLTDDAWKPQMRRSPFNQYLQNEPIEVAMTNYKRLTCCLLKENPQYDKCPYCPLIK